MNLINLNKGKKKELRGFNYVKNQHGNLNILHYWEHYTMLLKTKLTIKIEFLNLKWNHTTSKYHKKTS